MLCTRYLLFGIQCTGILAASIIPQNPRNSSHGEVVYDTDAHTTTPSTQILAGVSIPSTPLITSALAFTRAHSADWTYNHVVRSLLLGFIIADKVPSLQDRDREAHALAAILHDLGLPLGQPPHSENISPDKRFEVDGANAAREFLKREGEIGQWDRHRLQLIWDTIALHTTASIVFNKEVEAQAAAYGIWADLQGPDRALGGGVLTWPEYDAVVKEYPLLHLSDGFRDNFVDICVHKPNTTYDNPVSEWGDKYLTKEEYNSTAHLTITQLEASVQDLEVRESGE